MRQPSSRHWVSPAVPRPWWPSPVTRWISTRFLKLFQESPELGRPDRCGEHVTSHRRSLMAIRDGNEGCRPGSTRPASRRRREIRDDHRRRGNAHRQDSISVHRVSIPTRRQAQGRRTGLRRFHLTASSSGRCPGRRDWVSMGVGGGQGRQRYAERGSGTRLGRRGDRRIQGVGDGRRSRGRARAPALLPGGIPHLVELGKMAA